MEIAGVTTKMSNNDHGQLPEVIRPNRNLDIGYYMNLNIHKDDNDKYSIIKWYVFDEKQGPRKTTDALVKGCAYQPHWTGSQHVYQNKKVLLYLFERLPGVSFAYFKWSDEGCDGGKNEGKGKRSDCDSDAHDQNASWPSGLYLFDHQ